MILQLIVSQFNAKPIVCKFYGTCNPGLARDKILTSINVDNKIDSNILVDPRMLSPLYLSRIKRRNSGSTKLKQENETTIEIDGYRFPKDLNTVWSVSKFLNQTKEV